jgi:prevent-host-death family protein
MKTTSIRDFRSRISELIDSDEPVLVTRHGKNAAVLYPLSDPKKIPLEIRRRLFRDITASIEKELDAKGVTDQEIERDFAASKKRRRRQ